MHHGSKLLTFPADKDADDQFSTTDEELRAHVAYFALQRRAAEATTIRCHVNDLLTAGRHVIVLGDMNDGPRAATTTVLYGPPGSHRGCRHGDPLPPILEKTPGPACPSSA